MPGPISIISVPTHFQNQIKYKEGKTYTLPLPPNVLVHPQPLQNQHPNLLLHGHLGRLQLLRSNGPQQPPSTSQPEQHEIKLAAREEVHGDIQKAGIARTQGESGVGEAVTGNVGEGGGEDCYLGVCVFGFVGLFGGVVVGVVWSFGVVEALLVLAALVLMLVLVLTGDGGGGWDEGLGLGSGDERPRLRGGERKDLTGGGG